MLTLNTPFSVITNRAKKLVDDIEQKIQAGAIDTRITFLDELISAVSTFTNSLSEPSMTIPQMGKDELLVKEYLTEPFGQAADDLQLYFDQIILLRELTRQLFNICQAERAGLNENIAETTSLTDSLRMWVSDNNPDYAWVGDTFNDKSNIDGSSTVQIDNKTGTATLNFHGTVSLANKIVSATIDRKRSAGGLPGNSLEIQEPGQEAFTGETPEPRPILFGEVKPRKDSLASILDGNPDTWFEWERNYITPTQAVIQAGAAFIYDPAGKTSYKTSKKRFLGITIGKKNEGLQIPQLPNWTAYIKWPGDKVIDTGVGHVGYPIAYFKDTDIQKLSLAIDVVLDQPRAISWITLTPLIKGSSYPEVEQILFSTDGANWKSLISTPTVLHPRMNRGIDFSEYGDSASNFEGVGIWFPPSDPIKYLKFILNQTKVYDAELGFGHRFNMEPKKRKRIKGPVSVVGSFTSTLTEEKEIDFSQTEGQTQIDTLTGFDVFKGQRQVIAIRDLTLEVRAYEESGQLLSRPFTLDRDIKSVSLFTAERVPDSWASTKEDGTNWITYEVSADGQNWMPITPQITDIQESVIKFDTPTRVIYFRATLSRPTANPTESPVLLAYSLRLRV